MEVGSTDGNDVLCVIEAMKLFNEIVRSAARLSKSVDDNSPVEYDQPLLVDRSSTSLTMFKKIRLPTAEIALRDSHLQEMGIKTVAKIHSRRRQLYVLRR